MRYLIFLLLLIASPVSAQWQEARMNPYIAGSGGVVPPPSYGAEIQVWSALFDSATTATITVASPGIAVGKRAVLIINLSATTHVDSITDNSSGGPNIWIEDKSYVNAGVPISQHIFSSVITSALSAGDTITLTASGSTYSWATGSLLYVNNTTAVDQTGQANAFSATVTMPSGSWSGAPFNPSIIICFLQLYSIDYSYGSGNFTNTAATPYIGSGVRRLYFMYHIWTSGGYDLGGTESPGDAWYAIAVSYK
jgi:hypothetical protein